MPAPPAGARAERRGVALKETWGIAAAGRAAALALALFPFAAHCGAQQAERSAVVLASANLSDRGSGEAYAKLITEELAVETRHLGFRIIATERSEAARSRLGIPPEELVLGPRAIAVARAVGADVVATGFFRVDGDRITVEVKFYDAKEERLLAAVVRTGVPGLAVYNMIDEAVLESRPRLEALLGKKPSGATDSGMREIVFVSPDDGAQISLDGAAPVATVSGGRAALAAAKGSVSLTVESRKPGYHPRSERVALPPSDGEVRLRPLWRETRWAGELITTAGQLVGLGAGARYYLRPDLLYIGADDYLYMQQSFGRGGTPVFHDDLRVLLGRYLFFDAYSRFRMGIAVGAGAIVTVFADLDAGAGLDPYLSPANLWLEWNTRRWAFFWRIEGKFALGASTGLLPRGWLEVSSDSGGGPPPMTLGVLYKW